MKQDTRNEKQDATMQSMSKDNKAQNVKNEPIFIDYRMMFIYC